MKIGKEIYAMLEDNKRQVSVGEFMPISFDEETICCYNCDDKNQKILFLPAEMFFEDINEVHINITKMKESVNEVRQDYNRLFESQIT